MLCAFKYQHFIDNQVLPFPPAMSLLAAHLCWPSQTNHSPHLGRAVRPRLAERAQRPGPPGPAPRPQTALRALVSQAHTLSFQNELLACFLSLSTHPRPVSPHLEVSLDERVLNQSHLLPRPNFFNWKASDTCQDDLSKAECQTHQLKRCSGVMISTPATRTSFQRTGSYLFTTQMS